MNETKKKVLIVIDNSLTIGGVQDVVMSIVRSLSQSFSFDIILSSDEHGIYDKEFLNQGKIFRFIREKHPSLFGLLLTNRRIYKQTVKLLKNNKYDAIYCSNMFNAGIFLKAAKKCLIKNRIVHSQIFIKANSLKSKILYSHCKKMIIKFSTKRLAVTKNSGICLFGKSHFDVIKNPLIDVEYFEALRNKYVPDTNKIRLLHLGTLSERKNPLFSINVLYELVKINQSFHLTIAGKGDEKFAKKVHDFIDAKKLWENITFIPEYVKLDEVLCSTDYLILPSLSEGLPCVLIQAQCCGISCFVSSNVEEECNLGLCDFLDLSKGPVYWANQINSHYLKHNISRQIIDTSQWDKDLIILQYERIFNNEKQ